MTTLQCALKAS